MLLAKWKDGEPSAFEELMPLVYPHLRQVAAAYVRRERNPDILQATALVHELYLKLLYELLRDLIVLGEGGNTIRNLDLRNDLSALSQKISRRWIIQAVKSVDEIASLLRRNIQKTIALDGLLMDLRAAAK